MSIKEIYYKYINGDPITDKELIFGINEFSYLEEQLSQLGERFHITCKEIRRVNEGLKDYLKARK